MRPDRSVSRRHKVLLRSAALRLPLLFLALVTVTCGSSGSTPAPGPSPLPSGSPGPYVISGTVVENQTGRPIPGVTATFVGARSSTMVTDANGGFSVDAADGLLVYLLSAPGYLDRVSRLSVSGSRGDVRLDMISTAAPFSLTFYRQFARNGFDFPAPLEIRPWSSQPNFYLQTVTEDTGTPVPTAVVEGLRRILENSIPELSGGRRQLGLFEYGIETRPPSTGWVIVFFKQDVGNGLIGSATRGYAGDRGTMYLRYDPTLDTPDLDRAPSCESPTIRIALHEVVHTMGFGHTDDTVGDFMPAGSECSGLGRSARARYHAAIAYSRPFGNEDPDRDPPAHVTPLAEGRSGAAVIRCPAALSR